jgi:hypothetical protein
VTELQLPPDPDDPFYILLTAQEAADAMHVELAVIRQWKHRRIIIPVQTDNGPRFRKSELIEAELNTRRQRRLEQLMETAWEEAGRPE